jgi:NAD(P)-dependent dehydrogenase (short-subunit alcohol dehydrogenase family)
MFAKDFLAGKAAIVTGGARGLGFLFASVLAAQGASVPIQGVAGSEVTAARLIPRRRPSLLATAMARREGGFDVRGA